MEDKTMYRNRHNLKRPKCKRIGCWDRETHIHQCDYCIKDHPTAEHECTNIIEYGNDQQPVVLCGQKGHCASTHHIKAFCTECDVHGHTDKEKHYDCHHCGYVFTEKHIWCDNCSKCTDERRPHVGVCEFCQGCQVTVNCHDCEFEPKKRCIVCYKTPGDPERYIYPQNVGVKKLSH